MNKIKLGIFLILGFSTICLVLIVVRVSRVDITNKNEKLLSRASSQALEEKMIKAHNDKENEYIEKIKKITDDYQSLIDSLNAKTKETNNSSSKEVLSKENLQELENINIKLEKIKVPTKYKNFHLILSMSIFSLSQYVSTSNPEEMIKGFKLFQDAKEEYDNISYI